MAKVEEPRLATPVPVTLIPLLRGDKASGAPATAVEKVP